jgi:DNA polymerase-3 subunit epsilon
MKLIFDTETTGLKNYKAPKTHPSQPRMVQLGAILMEDNGEVRGEVNLIIKPDGWTVPAEAAAVHGITTEIAEKYGIPVVIALNIFNRFSVMADTLVAHNFDYDDTVMQSEFARIGKDPEYLKKNSFCTMQAATNVVKIPSSRGFKYPKLQETHKFLFGTEFEGAHDAMADVRACGRVYLELLKRNS